MRRTASIVVSSLVITSIVAVATWTQAQVSGGAPSPKSGTRIVTLGTRSGPQPEIGRAQSSNLLVVNGAQYIIDAGDGVTRRLIRLQTNFRNIDNIFITHPHSDHTAGLGALMSLIYDLRRTKPVNIYGPPGTEAGVRALLEFLKIGSEIRMSDGSHSVPVGKVFNGHDVGVGTIFQDANVKVSAVENTHFHFKPGSPGYGKYKSYSYRFDAPDRLIIFTGDTGPSDAVTQLSMGADVLVSEATDPVDEYKQEKIKSGEWQTMTPEEQAGLIRHHIEEHLVPEEVGKMAARAGVKTVILTHLQPAPNNDYRRYVELVKKNFSGQVLIAKDLMEF